MADITPIKKPFAPDDIVATLRRVADELEAGDFGLMTTCAIVLGHTTETPAIEGRRRYDELDYHLFGAGPRSDLFTVRGLLVTATIGMGE
jgi:hypothetical protein